MCNYAIIIFKIAFSHYYKTLFSATQLQLPFLQQTIHEFSILKGFDYKYILMLHTQHTDRFEIVGLLDSRISVAISCVDE